MTAIWDSLTSLCNAFSWTPYLSSELGSRVPRRVKLPDVLTALPDASSKFRVNALCKEVSNASDVWVYGELGLLSPELLSADTQSIANPEAPALFEELHTEGTRTLDHGDQKLDMKAGLLAAMCFPTADRSQLRLCTDFLNWMLLLEHRLAIVDFSTARGFLKEMNFCVTSNECCADTADSGFVRGLQSVLSRLKCSPEAPFIFDRFTEALQAYLSFLSQQILEYSERRTPPNIKMCMSLKRERGWTVLLFLLIEYSQGLKLGQVTGREKTNLRPMRDAAADAIIYASDIYARTSQGDPSGRSFCYNIVALLEHERSLDLQCAIDTAGELCTSRARDLASLESGVSVESVSSPKSSRADTDIAVFARGLGDCVRGVLHWGFESERYFGRDGAYVRMTMAVETTGAGTSQ
ncbi:hypothetical protein DFH11DRAFT_1507125 [Phellopilus nigrolimitatus]|nr:hypothetical protein DFH11DRAFT_1507125 [Phellopilus nigrolimitatus]